MYELGGVGAAQPITAALHTLLLPGDQVLALGGTPFPSEKGRSLPVGPSPFLSALGAGGQGLHGSARPEGSVPPLVPTPEGSGSARGHLPMSIPGLSLSPSPSLLLSLLDSCLSLWKKP